MSALDNIQFTNPFLGNLKKIDGLVVCKTKNDVEIHCCLAIKAKNGIYRISEITDILQENLHCSLDYNTFLDDKKGCYIRCYRDGVEYVTIIVQFVE